LQVCRGLPTAYFDGPDDDGDDSFGWTMGAIDLDQGFGYAADSFDVHSDGVSESNAWITGAILDRDRILDFLQRPGEL